MLLVQLVACLQYCFNRGGCRVSGATAAAQAGGVAALVRTVGSFSIASPHTGDMYYGAGVVQVPAACIAIEDADMLARMQARGQPIGATKLFFL